MLTDSNSSILVIAQPAVKDSVQLQATNPLHPVATVPRRKCAEDCPLEGTNEDYDSQQASVHHTGCCIG